MIHNSKFPERRAGHGFSIVELLVALSIGLILSLAVGSIFIQSKKSYGVQERLSRIQENGRFAMYFLMKDLRLAGYAGCLDELIANQTYSNHLKKRDDFPFTAGIPIEGLEMGTTQWYPSASSDLPSGWVNATTDAVMIRMVDPGSAITVSQPMPTTAAELNVSSVAGIAEGDILMISDCSSADIFKVTKVQTGSVGVLHTAEASDDEGNADQDFSKLYDTKARVMKYIGRRYYIANDDEGVPTLFRQTNTNSAEPLVAGIETLQITYGKDDNADRYADRYLPANHADLSDETEWASVVSVRIGILARAMDDKEGDVNAETYDVNGYTPPVANDRYRRRLYTATILLRNLSP